MQTVSTVSLPMALCARSSGDVDHDAAVQLDDFVVEDHRTLAIDDVIEFVGPLVVVELGVVDLDVVDLGGGPVFFLDEWADLPAGLFPGGDLGGVTAQELGGDVHGLFVSGSRVHGPCSGERDNIEIKVGAAVSIGNEEQPPVGVPGGMVVAGGVRRDVARV